ncbi:protoheme IX farnesyltransferase [Roseovarius azorensis]|uniref:Protoheme IX farnesyltransferase n=1 Tax=Roseovarius azorensis TaxID=1287727 RepID=A0A1H7V0K0_9RHOB|nr:heme o synthase [Roseovarius azorensis]SEM02674.1 protoheme IX farnesyltransferase [Roseovarius azorensis]
MPIANGLVARTALVFRSSRVAHFIALTKPRVMSLAIFTAFVGMVVAPGEMSWGKTVISIAAIAAGAGGAGALNMWYDAPIDARMARTANRPLPAGEVSSVEALVFGLVLAVVGVIALALAANPLAAGLLAGTIAFYSVLYTMWLKYVTPQNIVIGGAAGALPPVIGWTAATGSPDWQALVLFGIVFLWTPPHFWALALLKSADYSAARIPMLPVVAGETATKRQILAYIVVLAPFAAVPWFAGMAGVVYGGLAMALGAELLRRGWRLMRTPIDVSRGPARGLFAFSIVYLYAIFSALLLDAGV